MSAGSRVCEPTIRGEIKKARAGNYDISSCFFEYIDNSLDAGADRILVDLRERSGGHGHPHKVLVSDNCPSGIDPDRIRPIFSWTYERNRRDTDIGEYGAGFKTASVNLADKLTVITNHDGKCFQAIADWQDMADENRWEPKVFDTQGDYYNDIHPFHKGTTFLLESLRYEMFCASGVEKKWALKRLFDDIAYNYRYLIHQNPILTITLRGIWEENGEITEKDVRMHDLFQSAPTEPSGATGGAPTKQTIVRVYKDAFQFYRVYFHTDPKKWESIEFVERRKNGNSVLRCHEISPSIMDGMRLVDIIEFRSYHITDIARSAVCMGLYTTCTVDLLRKGRVVGRELALRAPRAEPLGFFVKHEVWYTNHALNALLGVQFNKQNHGILRENDLRHVLEYVQKHHERDFLKTERVKITTTTLESPSIAIPVAVARPTTKEENVLIQEDYRAPVAVVHPQDTRRRNFSSQTKIDVLHRQECRDSVMDFVLKDGVLLMDYDHKNGIPTINTAENCQALSVITHSIKTRCTQAFCELENNASAKTRFIIELLNCITRSKYFMEAWTSGQIHIRQAHQLSAIQNGIFDLIA